LSESKADVIKIPQVDRVLREPLLVTLCESIRRDILAQLVREDLDSHRRQFDSRKAETKSGNENGHSEQMSLEPAAIADRVASVAGSLMLGGVRRVINGTGVILNTNLGRAPLPLATLNKLTELGQGYTSLEIDTTTGRRGERTAMVSRLMSLLTGCESAIVVNNNASAVMLCVSALARGKEVIVSRGELIEIGGSFRLPDVVTAAGGILKEVGTTNRTRATDFRDAMGDNTGLILRCHRSNFEITGFTEEPKYNELVEYARAKNIPLADDLGSGALFDISKLGLEYEPTVDRVIENGVDVVMFSGDKLLGGPQAGIIAGKREYISRLRKDPMYRALRADKLIIALIEIVLTQYLAPDPAANLPVISLASQSAEQIKDTVCSFLDQIEKEARAQGVTLTVVECQSTLGGGSLPGKTLPSFGLEIVSSKHTSAQISSTLRQCEPSVISTIHDEKVSIDFRTILKRDHLDLLHAIRALWSS
jgi:L-seryl-tRNA(Ser) seleniumtransferase